MPMNIIIKNKTGHSNDTDVTDCSGNDIRKGLAEINLNFKAGEIVKADLKYVMVESIIEANPFLSLENIEYFAMLYGYKLVPK